MTSIVRMPQLGETVTEGTVMKWLVEPGDWVNKYEPICEIVTDKVTAEVPSTVSGIVKQLIAAVGDTIPVSGVMCEIEERALEPTAHTESASHIPTDPSHSQVYSPVVLALSREHHIDLNAIKGTGKGGRVTRNDILQVIKNKESHSQSASTAQPPTAYAPDAIQHQVATTNPILSNSTGQSHNPQPSWMMVEVDVTNLVKFREEKKDYFANREGLKLTYLPFFIRAVVESLKKYPQLNTTRQGDQLVTHKPIHLSIAVAASNKLLYPVIHHADHQSFLGLTQSIYDAVHHIKEGRFGSTHSDGGTFTLNNTGAIGSIESQPVIQSPQSAVLSIESITKRPVVMDHMFAIRSMVNLCLTVDSQVIDPLTCGHFLQSMKQYLENHITDTILY
ncbi:dihydrolipoamide acetyltransferase family protein [Paenibacillus sp. KN14-4R]|uniref:dihydrolipoamide acetyltransferase family protein n=1 Tax=Paenibacillus sp. KN14-4R TaxID=3445773 RepID=UPI003F9ED182